ncbi:ATP-binding protein [Streptomyces bobili]|uniref:ATP-binding protein n=1 Tax=Streptomyces bobili TaxID=67280 RepID=UPI0036FC32CB
MPVGSETDDGDGTVPGGHPLRAGFALGGDDGCIADARHRAAAFLEQVRSDHGLAVSVRAMDLTQLVVSELVTNARKYAPGPVLMELRVTTDSVEVIVWDSDPTVPSVRAVDPGRVGQHGLEIVKAVSEDLSVRQEPVGKRICARIALSDAPASDAGARRNGRATTRIAFPHPPP